jgi:hypothetical protein
MPQTEEQKQKIISLYAEHKTLDKTSEILNISLETLRQYCIENNIEYQKRGKYDCNHNFFGEDTEQSFYWAGFLAADGNVEKESNRIKLELAIKDVDHLYKFQRDIQSTAEIKTYTRTETRPQFKKSSYDYCKIRFNSAQMVKDLLRFGITSGKSKTYDVPSWIFEHHLSNHFFRGLIDGDGWTYLEKGHSNFGLCGSHLAMKTIYDHYSNYFTSPHYIMRDDITIIRCNNLEDNTKIINWLHWNATTWLDRKHEVQLDVLKVKPVKIIIRKDLLVKMLEETPLYKGTAVETYSKIAEKLNVSAPTIKRRLREFGLYNPQ